MVTSTVAGAICRATIEGGSTSHAKTGAARTKESRVPRDVSLRVDCMGSLLIGPFAVRDRAQALRESAKDPSGVSTTDGESQANASACALRRESSYGAFRLQVDTECPRPPRARLRRSGAKRPLHLSQDLLRRTAIGPRPRVGEPPKSLAPNSWQRALKTSARSDFAPGCLAGLFAALATCEGVLLALPRSSPGGSGQAHRWCPERNTASRPWRWRPAVRPAKTTRWAASRESPQGAGAP